MKPWRIELLGGLQITRDGQEPVAFHPQQANALLAYLALHPQKSHTREELTARLWPEEEAGEAAQKKLRRGLHLLRQRFEQPPFAQDDLLLSTRQTIGLDPALVSTDVQDFKQALSRATAATDPAERQRYLAQAVNLYKGDLLPGFYQDCFLTERNRLSDLYASALHLLTQVYEQAGDLERAVECARRAVALDPLMEEAHCTLMRLFAELGQPSAVVKQYQELERILKEEFGEEPSPATRQLMEALRQSAQQRVPRSIQQEPVPAVASDAPENVPEFRSLSLASAPAMPGSHPLQDLPTGTLTFLLTDIEGSTRLWERFPRAMPQALARHHAIIYAYVAAYEGQMVRDRGEGDSTFSVFVNAQQAVAAAARIQREMNANEWPIETPLRVRIALHTGKGELQDGDYHSIDINRCARLRAAAHGGQILLSGAACAALADRLPASMILEDLGWYRLKDLQQPERVFQLAQAGLPVSFPPLRSQARPSYRRWLPLRAVSLLLLAVLLLIPLTLRYRRLPAGPKPYVADAKPLWAVTYPAAADEKADSEPTAMTTDAAGNIYITGFVRTLHNDVDFLTLKYDPNGKLLWRARYNGPGALHCRG